MQTSYDAAPQIFSPPRPHPLLLTSKRSRTWLHGLLLVLTLLSTTSVGTVLALDFQANRPPFSQGFFAPFEWRTVEMLWQGLPFSLTLLTILLAHEMGHYLACRFYNVNASLPYFIPAPTFIGTMGAFIRIRSPIYSKRILFDIGIAGPLAGFLFLIPALGCGLAFSKVVPNIATSGELVFGTPLLVEALAGVVFPGVSPTDIYLHPVARAAWVGLLATALNLLPIGQLDGGHILYALLGERHRTLSRYFAIALIPLAPFFWWGWLIWAAILLLFGMNHPVIEDRRELGPSRRRLAALALAIFVVSLTLTPVKLAVS